MNATTIKLSLRNLMSTKLTASEPDCERKLEQSYEAPAAPAIEQNIIPQKDDTRPFW